MDCVTPKLVHPTIHPPTKNEKKKVFSSQIW
jgi:hypothetical protein